MGRLIGSKAARVEPTTDEPSVARLEASCIAASRGPVMSFRRLVPVPKSIRSDWRRMLIIFQVVASHVDEDVGGSVRCDGREDGDHGRHCGADHELCVRRKWKRFNGIDEFVVARPAFGPRSKSLFSRLRPLDGPLFRNRLHLLTGLHRHPSFA